MKNLLFTLVFILSFMGVGAQTKTIKISEFNANTYYSKKINLESNDTTYIVFLWFRDSIGEFLPASIGFTKQDDLNEFIADIKSAEAEMGTKTELRWARRSYSLQLNDYSNKLDITTEGGGWSIIAKKPLAKLIIWLETIQIGKG